MLQAAALDRYFLDLLSFSQNGFVPSKVESAGVTFFRLSRGSAGCCSSRRRPRSVARDQRAGSNFPVEHGSSSVNGSAILGHGSGGIVLSRAG